MLQSAVVLGLAALARASPFPSLEPRQYGLNATLDDYINNQYNISLPGALKNIGGMNNSDVGTGPLPGVVVASPSTVNPDYFYTWTRDSALTFLMLTDELIFGTEMVGNNSLQRAVEYYTTAQGPLQTVSNPSGTLWPAGAGLGEPKFYTNLTRFNDAWGRPQNDGPALRATTFMEVAEAIFQRNPNASQIVADIYWPLILNDLNYVGQYWNTTSYDLWEEVNGNSFFTTTAQHRALVQGSIWAERLNQTCKPCQQAPEILCFLKNNFWNESGSYFTANINANQVNRSQIGVDPILGAMHAFDINATDCNVGPLQPCNSKTLATHKTVVDSFRNLYPINDNATAPNAVAVGRYPEDVYYGGNPWYITTLACAEVLYDAAAQFRKLGNITVDNTSLAFFQDIYPDAKIGNYSDRASLANYTNAMIKYADGFVQVVEKYTPSNGTLNEQFNKTTGEPTSAIALTWSYAAFVSMSERRRGEFPPSWGASSMQANNQSSNCSASSYNATYSYYPATADGAPNISMPLCMKEVLFICNYSTKPGTNIYIVGDNELLGGSLSLDPPIDVLRPGNITPAYPWWNTPVWFNASTEVQYKWVLQNQTAGTYTFDNTTRSVNVTGCDGQVQRVLDSPTF